MSQPLPVTNPGDQLAKPDFPSGLQYPKVKDNYDKPVEDGRVPSLVIGDKPSRHPGHGRLCVLWRFLERSYAGGCQYKNCTDSEGQPVFITHEQESPPAATRRKRLATYRNFVKPIVDKFSSFVYGQDIPRDSSSQYSGWSMDVDGNGTSLHEFMSKASKKAALLGRWIILVDTTKSEDVMTRAQAEAEGARMVLRYAHPSRAIDWNEDWSVVLFQQDQSTYVLMDDMNITTATIDEEGKVDSMEVKPHSWGVIPMVCMKAGDEGLGIAQDVAELGKSIFNLDALLKEELYKQTFTQFWATGISSEDDLSSISVGSRKIICVNKPSGDVKIDRLAADPAQATSIRDSIDQDVKEVYRVVGLRMPDVLKQAESGVAIKLRFTETATICQTLANQFKAAEEAVNARFERAYGQEVDEPTYPDDFSEDDLQVELRMTLDVVGANMPPEVKAEKVTQWSRQQFSELDSGETNKIEKVIREFYSAKPSAPPAEKTPMDEDGSSSDLDRNLEGTDQSQ